jgi:hypothetical protein
MTWLRWIIALLALIDAAYMTLDGTRALTKGDYFTPTSGEHAGELGPWAQIVEKAGLEPRSTAIKTFFVAYGLVWLAVIVAFALKQEWSWMAMLVLALGSVWYLTVGTVISLLVALLLFAPAVRDLHS